MVTYRAIILSLLVSFNTFALSFSIEKETQDGTLQKAITLDEKTSFLVKNSNYFDKSSIELGKFKITNRPKFHQEIKELSRLAKALDLISSKVTKASSLTRPKHETEYLKVNRHFITSEHPLFKQIDNTISKIFEGIETKEIDVMKIIKEDGFLVKVLEKNNKQTKKDFRTSEVCRSESSMKICSDKEYGIIYLK